MTSVPTTRWSPLVLALLLTFCSLVARANIITVNDPSDTSGGRGCTLRDAIYAANNDTATGGCPAGSGHDTIVFGLIGGAKIRLTMGSALLISSDIDIQGPGAKALIIDGSKATRVLHVSAGTASISDVTITNGNSGNLNGGGIQVDGGATLDVTNSVITKNNAGSSGMSAFFAGGGINNQGTLTLTNCTISGNVVGFKGGPGAYGGGIENEGTATLIACTISGNQSVTKDGGGIRNFSGTLTISNSTISGNKATGNGGGLEDDGTATVTGSTISKNSAKGNGGGINKTGSGLNVTNCTISDNTATENGGGVADFNTQPPPGAVLINCTVSGNKASGGGGVDSPFGGVTLGNTIIANSATTGGDCDGTVADNGNNLIQDATNDCGLTNGVNGDIVGSNANLAGLRKNGGPTLTMAFAGASPALAAGSPATCGGAPVNNYDQRGLLRHAPTSCDIGAYESP